MQARAIDAVMFDLGGVLVRIRREWTAQCAAVDVVPTPRSLEPLMRAKRSAALDAWQRGDQTLEACSAIWASTLDPDAPASVGRALLESIVDAPYQGTVELIDDLHALGVVTGCLSNTNGLHWERMLREFPALSRLQHRLASHEVLLAKPEPAIYAHAAEVLGQAPSYRAAPELYKQFRTMQVLGRSLAGVRTKLVLGDGVAGRADLDLTLKQSESGLNLADYLEKKEPAPGQGAK